MMKTRMFMVLIGLIMALSSCGMKPENQKETQDGSDDRMVKVFCFHGKQRCMTCMAMEKFTEELLNQQYTDKIETGAIVYKCLGIDENEALADHYEIAWSSLILDRSGQVVNLTDMAFRYAHSNPEEFKHQLRTEIDKLLE